MKKIVVVILSVFISLSTYSSGESDFFTGPENNQTNNPDGNKNKKPINIEKYIKLTSSHTIKKDRGYVTGDATIYINNEGSESIKSVTLTLKSGDNESKRLGGWDEIKKGQSKSVRITFQKHYYPDVILEYTYNNKKYKKEYNYR